VIRSATAAEIEHERRERAAVCADLEMKIVRFRSPGLRRGLEPANVRAARDPYRHGRGDERRARVAEELLKAAERGELSKLANVDYGDGEILWQDRADGLWAIRLREEI
jgi:hypothetical protein